MVIGNYRLLRKIGEGGMGIVYQGEHVMLGRSVAIKVLHKRFSADAAYCQRFLHEARAVSQIHDPNVIDVTDFGLTADGSLYFVMEYFEGRSLSALIASGPLPLFRAIGILSQVSRALAATHRCGVVHRDLKPENVLMQTRSGRRDIVRILGEGADSRFIVEKEGTWDFIKVIDFGVGRFQELAERSDLVMGTPLYMAPEQIRGGEVDGRADIYSLGILFFEMLTGQPPFSGNEAHVICQKHLYEPPPLPRLLRPDLRISQFAEAVILKAIAKNPERRYPTMDAFHDDLQSCFSGTYYKRDAARIPGAHDRGILAGRRKPKGPTDPTE